MSDTWKTSVTEILTIFRDALIALIPTFEKAQIRWKEGEAYDDFDNIAEALYSNIVCSSLTGEVASHYNLPGYDSDYNDYASMEFIEVRCDDNDEKRYAFIAFQNNLSTFDSVKVAELDKSNKVISHTILSFDALKFLYNSESKTVDVIEVML